jgi:hypothetical protein
MNKHFWQKKDSQIILSPFESENVCSEYNSGEYPLSTTESMAVKDAALFGVGYFKQVYIDIRGTGSFISKPWQGNSIQDPIYNENVSQNFYYWNNQRNGSDFYKMVAK